MSSLYIEMSMRRLLILTAFLLLHLLADAQGKLDRLHLKPGSVDIERCIIGYTQSFLAIDFNRKTPLVTFEGAKPAAINISVDSFTTTDHYISTCLHFTNISKDTLVLKNVVPFGRDSSNIYITGLGNHGLSRTHLFIPGRIPVNVIVPDNAWDLGFSSMSLTDSLRLYCLVRRDRTSISGGSRSRFETTLYPGGSVRYFLYASISKGDWRQSLKQVFMDRMLYDTTSFDNTLYEREDLKWIRHTYVHHLMMAWDKFYYDGSKFRLEEFLARGRKLYGGDDVVSIWPTWPALGLDQRNQFDLFRDLPGGTKQIKKLAEASRKNNTRFFVCYNPWDESTRMENHFSGLSDLIKSTSADGVILDTRGGSSRELQEAADRVRKGVIMYSEGMAVPRDMTGIVSGRVHNALYYPPMLNLNKLIKPEFAIYRVAELYKEPIQREFATSFFNGYGTEINIMSPGQPAWAEDQYKYLGRTSRILRENTLNFVSKNYNPLIDVVADSIWVNEWPLDRKTLYTLYSVRPQGYKGLLFEVKPSAGFHFVDLWYHRELTPRQVNGKWMIEAETDAFHQKYLGTNNEGEVDCIAKLPVLLEVRRNGDMVSIATKGEGDELRIWAGHPAYDKEALKLKPGDHTFSLSMYFGRYEGDFVVQLMKQGILQDETIIYITPGEPRRISTTQRTIIAKSAPQNMSLIPAGKFIFHGTNGDEFISYPKQDEGKIFEMPSIYMDRYPVTNVQYRQFIQASGYRPADTTNYLKHWSMVKYLLAWKISPLYLSAMKMPALMQNGRVSACPPKSNGNTLRKRLIAMNGRGNNRKESMLLIAIPAMANYTRSENILPVQIPMVCTTWLAPYGNSPMTST